MRVFLAKYNSERDAVRAAVYAEARNNLEQGEMDFESGSESEEDEESDDVFSLESAIFPKCVVDV